VGNTYLLCYQQAFEVDIPSSWLLTRSFSQSVSLFLFGDPETTTGLEKVKFLTYGSPKLRYILHQVHTYVLSQTAQDGSRKLLIIEDISLTAFSYQSVFNMLYVKSEILHVELFDIERVHLIKRFNDLNDSLLIFIIMYRVSAQRVNLDTCCFRILVSTSIINASSKIQAWFRLIRICSSVVNSYQYDKSVMFFCCESLSIWWKR
jgi:hypothetical protein